jgi:hypothetical protein
VRAATLTSAAIKASAVSVALRLRMFALMPDGAEKLYRLRKPFTEADSLGSEFVSINGISRKDYPASHRNADI